MGLPRTRPYDLRHSFASLLVAAGKQPLYVASQLGHSPTVLLRDYAHLFAEYEDGGAIDPEQEIAAARDANPRPTPARSSATS